MTNKQEIIMMKTDGEAFHHYYLDVIKDHKQKTFKVAASFLLVKLSERFDGLGTFMINFCLQLIDYCLNNSEITNIPKYTILNQSATSPGLDFSAGVQKILTGLNPEIQMDTSILILLILREQVSKSTSALAILRLVLESQADKLFSIGSEIIKDKLSLLFGHFLDELYQEDEVETFYNHLYRIFEFLFLQILNFHNNPGLAYTASYALNQLIYYKSYGDVSNNIVRKIMPQLIRQIKEIEVVLFFDVLIDIVLYLDIEDHVLSLSREISNRILKEIKSSRKNDDKEMNVYIGKCFNLLRTVLEKNKMFNAEGRSSDIEVVIESSTFEVTEFEKIIEPVVTYIKNPNKINFDEEIIFLMTNLLQNTKQLTNLSKMIFPSLHLYIIKHDGMTEELYELLNLYITNDIGHGYLNNHEEAKHLCNMIRTSIEECDEYALSPILACLLIQAWLQSSNNIPQDIVNDLISLSLRELSEIYTLFHEEFETLRNSFEVFPFTAFITTLYSALITYPYAVLNKINEHNKLVEFINSTELMLQFDYFSTYQSKVNK
jgi:importin-7